MTISSKCFRDVHYHMISQKEKWKLFVMSILDLRFTKRKEINDNTWSNKLLIHLNNNTLKNRHFY